MTLYRRHRSAKYRLLSLVQLLAIFVSLSRAHDSLATPLLPDTHDVALGPPTSKKLQFSQVTIHRGLEADLIPIVGPAQGRAVAQVVKRVLVWWVNPRRDLRKGDHLEFVWEARTDAEPLVHGVWFKSGKLGTQKIAVLIQPEKQPFHRWVEPHTGYEVALRLKSPPVHKYEQITSLLDDGRGHRGVDFKAPVGTPVVAPFSGTILKVNWSTRRNGRCVKIRNEGTGWEASFLHLSSVGRGIKVGRKVKKGQRVGKVGNTGHSFAPHLHYQIEKNGRVLDPMRVQRTWRAKLSKADQDQAQSMLNRLAKWRGERS